jgi:hypothetical protein
MIKNFEALKKKSFGFSADSKYYNLPTVLLDRYIFNERLNFGCFGTIFNVLDSKTKKFVVAKVFIVSKA